MSVMNIESAAEYIAYSIHSLKASQRTGYLSGIEAPHFINLNDHIVYEKTVLDDWLNELSKLARHESMSKTASAHNIWNVNGLYVTQ